MIRDGIDILHHISIRQPQHQIPLALKHTIANGIPPGIFRQAVLGAIEFDDHASIMLYEIENVRAKWCLASKMVAQITQRPEARLQFALSVRDIAPEPPCAFDGKRL